MATLALPSARSGLPSSSTSAGMRTSARAALVAPRRRTVPRVLRAMSSARMSGPSSLRNSLARMSRSPE